MTASDAASAAILRRRTPAPRALRGDALEIAPEDPHRDDDDGDREKKTGPAGLPRFRFPQDRRVRIAEHLEPRERQPGRRLHDADHLDSDVRAGENPDVLSREAGVGPSDDSPVLSHRERELDLVPVAARERLAEARAAQEPVIDAVVDFERNVDDDAAARGIPHLAHEERMERRPAREDERARGRAGPLLREIPRRASPRDPLARARENLQSHLVEGHVSEIHRFRQRVGHPDEGRSIRVIRARDGVPVDRAPPPRSRDSRRALRASRARAPRRRTRSEGAPLPSPATPSRRERPDRRARDTRREARGERAAPGEPRATGDTRRLRAGPDSRLPSRR